MSKMLGAKIGLSASVIPVLLLAWTMACHHRGPQKNDRAPKPREPQVTRKSLVPRKYNVASNYKDIYIFTDPEIPDQHCIGTNREASVYNCYPNAPGLKIGTGGLLDLVLYRTPDIGDVLTFTDPENPALHCVGNMMNRTFTCTPKAPPAPPPPQPK